MVSRFVRRVRTGSGAVAVQVVTKQGQQVLEVDHVGSARTDAELTLLLEVAAGRLRPNQEALDLGEVQARPARMNEVADFTIVRQETSAVPAVDTPGPADRLGPAGARVVSTSSLVLWNVLAQAYARVGLDVLADEAFRAMVLARIVEPTSKADSLRVLAGLGAPCPDRSSLFRALKRCQHKDYRSRIATVLARFSSAAGRLGALVMYDVTTLHFEVSDEDEAHVNEGLRKVGMSKEHRVDPQVQVGLLVDPSGFPLEAHLFDGKTAETKTIVPVLQSFQKRHGIRDLVVVADAGMLSAGNLNAIEDAGFSFIVGSRITKAPYDLADHFTRHGDYFTDGQILESFRTMGQGNSGPKAARDRRVVYQWRFARSQRDNRNINAMVAKAEKIAAGQAQFSRVRFLKITGETTELNQATVDRARQLAGLKGYVTNLDPKLMNGAAVISAYHDLWKVEASFRMTKFDLKARPIFHHTKDAIEAHLTVVFAALAVARDLQERSGTSIKKIIQTLREARSATIEINGQHLTLDPELTPATHDLLQQLDDGH
jgi:transposase